MEIMEKVSKGYYQMADDKFNFISEEGKNLIRKMLEFQPKQRITALEAVNDDWFKKIVGQQDVEISSNVLENLRSFNCKSKLQQAVYYFIVNNMATKEEKNDLMKTFKALDTNGDGQLSKDELMKGYHAKNLGDITEDDIDAMLGKLDNNQSGVIDYTEFVGAAIDREKLLSKQRVEACFRLFDKDKSGTITKSELKVMFGGGSKVDDEVWNDLIKEVDINGDGEISFSEFKDMLLKLT